jgi:deoxyribose-phosphate aldolase
MNLQLYKTGRMYIMTQSVNRMIDHTLLKANATKDEIVKLVEEAKKYSFASVCVNPTWVKISADMLKDSPEVKVCTVIGFPLGASTPETKAFETRNAIENGAHEIDMVINIGALKDKQDDLVERDIKAVVEAAKGKALTKVIIETCLLTNEEKVIHTQSSKHKFTFYQKKKVDVTLHSSLTTVHNSISVLLILLVFVIFQKA